jgi:HEAT repeat protein
MMTRPSDPTLLFEAACRPAGGEAGLERDAVEELHRTPSREVLDLATSACLASDPVRRAAGSAVLGQLGHNRPGFVPVFPEERHAALTALLAFEDDPSVMAEVLVALGHLHDPRCIAAAALRPHPDAGVRLGVVHCLSGHEDPVAVDALASLTADVEAEVRDWATFGLGQLTSADTEAVRAALRARLADADADVRSEAVAGLAARRDPAAALADRGLMPALEAARAAHRPLPEHLKDAWLEAAAACGGGGGRT